MRISDSQNVSSGAVNGAGDAQVDGSGQPGEEDIARILKEIELILMQMANKGGDDDAGPAPVGAKQQGNPLMDIMQRLAQLLGQDDPLGDTQGDTQGGGAGPSADGGGAPAGGGGGGAPAAAPAAGGASPAGGVPATQQSSAAPAPAQGGEPSKGAADTSGASGATQGGGQPAGGLSTEQQTKAYTPEESMNVAKQYMANLQKDFGLTDFQAAGIVGNLMHESSMNPSIHQGGAIAPIGGAGHQDDDQSGVGIAQWGGVRADAFVKNADSLPTGADGKKAAVGSDANNYSFFTSELRNDYKGALDAVKGTTSLADSTSTFCNDFEKPRDPQMQSRQQYAQQLLDAARA